MSKIAVVAVGGNSLIKDKQHQTIPDQYAAAVESSRHVVSMIEQGWDVLLTHGNGPQVGYILRRSELSAGELHPVPLDYCGADTQGAIGYMFQQALQNEFKRRGIVKSAATVVTQTLVDGSDPAFQNPTKPIGSFMEEPTARAHARDEGWSVVEDAGRGWRRVVPSPAPVKIVEFDAIMSLIRAGFTVVASGGGGIPVVEQDGQLVGVEAVIDKDYAAVDAGSRPEGGPVPDHDRRRQGGPELRQAGSAAARYPDARAGEGVPRTGTLPEGLDGSQGPGDHLVSGGRWQGSADHHAREHRTRAGRRDRHEVRSVKASLGAIARRG